MQNNPEIKRQLKIETIKGPENSELSWCPERGGIITSLKLKGKEILYMDPETFDDPTQNVKGGIPILFPNAGPLPADGPYPLKQHGFGRTSAAWQVIQSEAGQAIEQLRSSPESRAAFPFDLLLRIRAGIETDGSITLEQQAINQEPEKEMPVAFGLHPYFQVEQDKKGEIKFDFPGGEIIEKEVENWSGGGTTSIDNPKLKDIDAVLRVHIPGAGWIVMDVSPEYRKIWVWSLPGKGFVCIEPVMRDPGGLIDDPEMVRPGHSYSAKVNYRLE